MSTLMQDRPPVSGGSERPRRRPTLGAATPAARVEPPVRAEGLIRVFDAAAMRVEALVDRLLPEPLNPLAQTGAIANTTFLVAIASGVALLLFYSPSLHLAYDSVSGMAPHQHAVASLVRSLHRYSSDACMLFVLLHALKLFFARRFGGARWLAWVTGAFLVGTLWFVGWLGYWLVWDERARQIALGTARMLDSLPIFADPLSRSFLTDDQMSSLLFFVVFFVHMLVPLAMGIALWLHITRLSRPHFLTKWRMTLWVVASLALVAWVAPADVAKQAHMTVTPSGFHMDAWYLAPLGFTDRLRAGALWTIALTAGAVFFSVPWALARGRARVAEVIESRCNACELCYKDCPYDAITMVPRTDDKPFASRALVNADKCLGCGICAGSCNSAGIGLPWFDVLARRAEMDHFVDAAIEGGDAPLVAFVCAESAGAKLHIDPLTAECRELPGYRVMRVPCSGWVHALTVERALRHGARGVLVVACGPGSGVYREGGKWTRARMEAQRAPALNLDKVDGKRVRVVELFRTDLGRLQRDAKAFREGVVGPRKRSRAAVWAGGALVAALFSTTTWAASRASYRLPTTDAPELVVSFKHPGQRSEKCHDLTDEELRKTPPHMRPPNNKICERKRDDVRMRVTLDGRVVVNKSYAPTGLWSDGNSTAIERLEAPPGEHDVKVSIGDGADPEEFAFQSEQRVEFSPRAIRVVRFDRTTGFEWR